MEIDPVDRISNLPEFILHDILSLLPRKDAARTSVLSKQWNCVWESFPVLEFEQETFLNTPLFTIDYSLWPRPEQVGNFLNGVKHSLMRFCLCKLNVRKFRLVITLIGPNLDSKVDECLKLVPTSGASEIGLVINKVTPGGPICRGGCCSYILPETMFKVTNPLIKYYSLQKLELAGICISEKSIQDIVHNCPNISFLRLVKFSGLQNLDITKLYKLEVLVISPPEELLRVNVDSPNLRYFDFISFRADPLHTIINLNSCHDLRMFWLSKSTITDEVLHSLLSRFPLLEDLSLISCNMLRRVKISAKYLKHLSFLGCNKIEAIEIDAPSLTTYEAETLPRNLSINNPSQLEIVHRLWDILVNTSCFLNFREFVALATSGVLLTLRIYSIQVSFDLEELRQVGTPPAFELAHLKLDFGGKEPLVDEPTFIDGLLWSCHPKKISIPSGSLASNSCIKIICERLLDMEKGPTCCGSSHIKCWRHDLKSARIESIGGVLDMQQLVHWKLLLDKLPSDAEGPVICFQLEWSLCYGGN